MGIRVEPATSGRSDDVATVLGPKDPSSSVCWCLSHRLDAKTNRELVGPARGAYVKALCDRDVAPGVLAYDGEDVVGWAAVAPRAELPFARSTKIPHVDDLPVWSAWCIRVRPGHRGKGISHRLLEGAVAYARSRGAPAAEGYPVDNGGAKVDLTMAYVGTRAVFERAGFVRAAETQAVSRRLPAGGHEAGPPPGGRAPAASRPLTPTALTRHDVGVLHDFALARVDVGDGVTLRVRHAGSGPPVVLLHGHPRTHTTWHAVAPRLLAAGHTVVCPDLRGYGQSSKPPTTADHSPYSKRAMARDVLVLMRLLGHESFAVVGHDRGSYVAARLGLDAPQAVTRLAVLDSVPIGEALARADARFAAAWWHWFFFAQPDKPERAILADPEAWYGGDPSRMGQANHADFLQAIRDPATVRAMLEDYRAGLGVDRAADDADRAAGRRLSCPVLVLWSTDDDLGDLYGNVLAVWEPWADDLRGGTVDSGHHMAEDAPEQLADALVAFLLSEDRQKPVRTA